MPSNEKSASALLALFPTQENFQRFAAHIENAQPLETLLAFAVRAGLIPTAEEDELARWIEMRVGRREAANLPKHFRFEDLFEKKESLLEFNLSARALSDRINALLNEHRIDLPRLSNSMLSRLKKETADTLHKQNVLRSLAFWIGHERGHLADRLHHESLLALCRQGHQSVEHRQGVRIGFALFSRGDVIDHDTVGWLKRELKDYLENALNRFVYGRWGKVRAHDITTLYVDLPKEEEAGDPAAYRQCVRSAVSLAHQMAIRWALSEHFSQNRFLSIGIAAGDFVALDTYLVPILNAKLPGDPVIRLTDYARQCVQINDIRALLCTQPAEITLLNGETLVTWWVEGLWSTLYFDFVPALLTEGALSGTAEARPQLAARLWPSVVDPPETAGASKPDAVATFFRFPRNALLGLEIAKTLYYRRSFWEALEILRVVLSLDPAHLNARVLRMVLLRNLALDAPTYRSAVGLFRQAHHEARYILENCVCQAEDFYCEYAVIYLAQAMDTLRRLRAGGGSPGTGLKTRTAANRVMAWLAAAEKRFEQGMMVSPTGIRAIYLLNSVKLLQVVLAEEPRLFKDSGLPLGGDPETLQQTSIDFQWQLGYHRDDLPMDQPYALTDRIFKFITRIHDDSIALQAYRPTTYFCTAAAWWDMFPVRTVGTARHTLRLLQDAAGFAAEMGRKEVCIYSFTRTYGEMMPVPIFLAHIENAVRLVEEVCGGRLTGRDEAEPLQDQNKGRRQLLLALNF